MAVVFKERMMVGTIKENKRKPIKMAIGHWGNNEDKICIRSYYDANEDGDEPVWMPGKGIDLTQEQLETVIKLYEENKDAITKALMQEE